MSDLKDYSKRTTKNLVIGFVGILLFIGLGIVAIIWGVPAAASGLLCIAAAGIPILIIWVILWVIDKIVKRSQG